MKKNLYLLTILIILFALHINCQKILIEKKQFSKKFLNFKSISQFVSKYSIQKKKIKKLEKF